jgi:hypothetical protein
MDLHEKNHLDPVRNILIINLGLKTKILKIEKFVNIFLNLKN